MTDSSALPAVLIVEDNEELAETFATWLDPSYDVSMAHTGAAAIDTIDHDDIDVVLLDRRLPDFMGEEVLERVRNSGYEGGVCMVTAVQPDFDILDMGFDDYVVKPVFRDDLHDIVEALLTRSSYDTQVQQLYALASKLSALETEKSQAELAASDEYAALADEFEALRQEIDATRSALTDERDYEAVFRAI